MKWAEMGAMERDALVAEKVMGKNRQEFEFLWPAMLNYSTDISAAWEVVEKFGLGVIPQSVGAPVDMKYMATRYGHKLDNSNNINAFAQTAPEAICLAALRAVGEEV